MKTTKWHTFISMKMKYFFLLLAVLFFVSPSFATINLDGQSSGVTILKLRSHSYTIKEAMEIIYAKLPLQYSQAYSLQLNNLCTSFDGAIVKEIQWLESKARPDEIQKAFPREEIYYHYGKAYLIFDDGHKEQF